MIEQKVKAWYIGNTTIRNASRIKDGLRVLVDSPLHGNLEGHVREQQFAVLLNNVGMVRVRRFQSGAIDAKDASDLGRKWRVVMMQMGFITPGPASSKQPYTVTPNGRRLLISSTLPEEQECFLRALVALQLPSQVDRYIQVPPFSPLRVVLETIAGLENAGLDAWISQEEMAFIVQLTTSIERVDEAIKKIIEYREALKKADRAKAYIKKYREMIAKEVKGQKEATIYTYADANFRYLKLTGLFAEGRRLRFSDYKRTIINQLLSVPYKSTPPNEYLDFLWNGASLPTDTAIQAIEAIETTANILRSKAGPETTEGLMQLALISNIVEEKDADLSRLRLKLEDDLLKLLEVDFASKQREQWEDIVKYFQELMKPTPDKKLVPSLEAPAYFEWALWRAFLAINSLFNKPWNARRFKIDQEFKPVSPAASGGPDMIFEFEKFVIVVEVTLTTSSRQEAAEGEPVRRHVADLVMHYQSTGKKVYGLFLANRIDTNTAETFRIGSWYLSDDTRLDLQVVPLTLRQFTNLFEASFKYSSGLNCQSVEDIIHMCVSEKNDMNAPKWKSVIEEYVSAIVQQIQGTPS